MNYSPSLSPANASQRARPPGRVPAAFARRFYLFLLVGLVWTGPAWWEPRFLYGMAAWDMLAVALWLADVLRLPRARNLEVERVWSAPVGLQTDSRIDIVLRNYGRVAVLATVVDDVPSALRSELPVLAIAAPAGGEGRASYTVRPRERGDAPLGCVSLRYSSAWQLGERWAEADLRQTVRVYPNLEESKHNTIYLIRTRQIELEKRLKRQHGRGREFESLREHRQGDDKRDICWTATARRGKLITKTYQIERSQVVWLVLDVGRLLRARVAGQSKLDFAVNAALSLAQVALFSGDRVALLAYGRKPQQRLAPGRGPSHLRQIVECLAMVRGEALEADHLGASEALLAVQKRRSLIVWLTDVTETATTPEVIECASRMTNRHLLLFVAMGELELAEVVARRPEDTAEMYRYTAAVELIQQRELLLRRLRQQGALTLEVEPGRLSTALLNQYFQIKERSLL